MEDAMESGEPGNIREGEHFRQEEQEGRERVQAQEGVEEEEETSDDGDEEDAAPSHLPFAPITDEYDVSTTVDPSYIISLIRKLLPPEKGTDEKFGDKSESMNHSDSPDSLNKLVETQAEGIAPQLTETSHLSIPHTDNEISSKQIVRENFSSFNNDSSQYGSSAIEDSWEESGCVLWDLSADKNHAKFMVDNLILEVLLANFTVSNPSRVTEICLGIIGNLACHDGLSSIISSTNGLIKAVVSQLSLDDSACLSETCRLIAVSLKNSSFASWVEALQQECCLERILWISENTLNPQLLEKSIELILVILERQEVAPVLVPALEKLGLSNLLVGLISYEKGKVLDENKLERLPALDLILRCLEALSTIDSCSKEISSNTELFQILCSLVKLPDKFEVSNLCVTVPVILANIFTDEPQLASHTAGDVDFLQGLLDIFPIVSTDLDSRSALWSILARLLSQFQVNNMCYTELQKHVSILLDKASLIEEDLAGHHLGEDGENLDTILSSLKRIAALLNRWITEKAAILEGNVQQNDAVTMAYRLLDYCTRHAT